MAQGADEYHVSSVHSRVCAVFPDNSFDRVVSRLGAMFFPNEAFAEILRVTKPDGRVGLGGGAPKRRPLSQQD